MGKYLGIDEREIKCINPSADAIESGISFDEIGNGQKVLRFHFLEYIGNNKMLMQKTKAMFLDKNNVHQLIEALKELEF